MKHNIALLISAITVCVMGFGGYVFGTALITTQHQVQAAVTMRETNSRLLGEVLDAETGQRGYLLTGNERYLEPYYATQPVIASELASYERLDLTGEQKAFVATVTPLVIAKLDELTETISLRRHQGFEAALKVVQTDAGKASMDALREAMSAERLRLLATIRTHAQQITILTYATLGAFFGGLTAMMIFAYGLRGLLGGRDRSPPEQPL